jgi:ribosomal protein L31E
MFEIEKSFDTLRLVAENTQKIADSEIQKSEEQQLHAVKRLVRPTDGTKPYYRTYWVSDWQHAAQAQRDNHEVRLTAKKVIDTKKDLDKKPDDSWYTERHMEALKEHGKTEFRLKTLDQTAVKKEDRAFKTKRGVAPFVAKEAELESVKVQIEENQSAWDKWSKEGPEKVREQAQADYKKAWSDAGLELENYYDFDGKVKSSDGKTDLISIQHRADYNFRSGDAATYEAKMEVRLRHSAFDTKDPEDFKYMSELSDALAKINTVASNPKLMKDLNDLRLKAYMADKTDAKNNFSEKGRELSKKKVELEKQILSDKIDDVVEELGGDSFELERDFHFENGRKHAPRYRYAKVVKSTPKQVEVGFSDTPGNDKSFYNTKRMSHDDFRQFMGTHVDLDAHLPNYTGEQLKTGYGEDTKRYNEQIETEEAAKKQKSTAQTAEPSKLSDDQIVDGVDKIVENNGDPQASAKKFAKEHGLDESKVLALYKRRMSIEKPSPKKKEKTNSSQPWQTKTAVVATKEAKPEASASSEKKVVGHEKFTDPVHGEYNKGDQVVFEHKGEMKGGKVLRVNVYQRFPNPYVVMEGSDGKKYELVISKVNVHKD